MGINVLAQLPKNLREHLAVTSGLMLGLFDPLKDLISQAEEIKENILFATDGGVNTTFSYTYKDMAEGIDNCPRNTMELLTIESASSGMSGTAKTVTAQRIKDLIAHADISDNSGVSEITPRMAIEMSDFKSYWHVCPYGVDGFIAIHLKNALNTGGFNWQTADKDKSSFPFSYVGYSSLENPDVLPLKVFVKESSTTETTVVGPTTEN